jgi:hypothetical protein
MANEIKEVFSSAAALTITLASLPSSTSGVGRQATMVDNTLTRYQLVKVFCQIKLGTSPAANTSVYVYLVRGDRHGTPYRTDGAGASDAAWTVLNAGLVGILRTKASPSTGDLLYGDFDIVSPGPEWSVAVVHDTGVNLDSTGGNHFIHWVGADPEIQ